MTEGWRTEPLGQVCLIKPPKSEVRKALNNSDLVSFVPMSDLGEGEKALSLKEEKPLSEVIGSYTYFAENDVLLAKITPCLENGKLGIARNLRNGVGFGSSEYVVFRTNARVDPDYLYYFLSQDSFREVGARVMSGAVGHKRVPKEFIEEYPIPLPASVDEQKRIVAILDAACEGIDAAVANAEQNIANVRALLENWVDGVFGRINEEVGSRSLGELTTLITKGSSPKWQGIDYVDEPGILFVTSENVGSNEMTFARPKFVDEKFNFKDKKSVLKRGDVLTNIVGASIGRTAVFERDELANINQAVCLIRCNPNALVNRFLAYMLNSTFFKRILHENERDNARANLSLGFFRSLDVPCLPVAQQDEMVSQINEVRDQVSRLEVLFLKKLNLLRLLKQSLLHKAFTGGLTTAPEPALNEVVAVAAE